ncbi:MAG: succinate dehydrogenase [Bacteroidales bacterium]|nr:succinate dehydrogenase [Bacteroidales bacterium]
MATIFVSSIGKKLIQSISGAFLILFLLLHGTINFFSVIDSFTGKFGAPDGLYQMGCDFMALPIVTIMTPVLALGFVVHILWGLWLSYGNIKARGGLKRYEVSSKAKTDSWSSKNMLVLGLLVLLGLACHLSDFWAKMQLQEFLGREAENPYELLTGTFGRWWLLLLYLLWFAVICLHLNHGFWSMFQTVGWNNMIWLKRLKVIGTVVASLIIFLFVATACNAYLQAHLWI